ncbi:transcriptional regulator, TetR family [Poseidonocella pacifica]|uniref:Transcriptional regulator, TetR family n=1 Tax=Poseidonocella pacifica TaxID=871651 RepID=A0A1I0WFM7_9RHOB|nr:TetR family transcriptional regulator C-terminal domain-containing protein [Poseidonocella pacifica]SFA87559.1 transcriptional regulator, TetR family [Poseidonocella pacifica]
MDDSPPKTAPRKTTRIQKLNRKRILDAALEVFSSNGFRGSTLDMIAGEAGLSKPNILYYFDSKEAMHVALLNELMDAWLEPLEALNPDGEPLDELMGYVQKKMEMSRKFPRESRLFANEIIQGAPRMAPHLAKRLKPLFDAKATLLRKWMAEGRIAQQDAEHLIMSIWAVTQHYADFEAQLDVLIPKKEIAWRRASDHVEAIFRKLLHP